MFGKQHTHDIIKKSKYDINKEVQDDCNEAMWISYYNQGCVGSGKFDTRTPEVNIRPGYAVI